MKTFFGLLLLGTLLTLQACGNTPSQPSTSQSAPIVNNVATNTVAATATGVANTIAPKIATVSPMLTSIKQRWLKGIPCKLPCFEGITPGRTTITEAAAILQQSPVVDVTTIEYQSVLPYDSKTGSLKWHWQGEKNDNYATIDLQTSNHLVVGIEPDYGSFQISFSELVTIFGEPTHISVGNSVRASITFYWLNKGFIIGADGTRDNPNLELSPNLLLGHPAFHSISSLLESTQKGVSIGVAKWEGFKGFKYYCERGRTPLAC